MSEERTREDYLHKIGELEDVIEVQEATIDELQKRSDRKQEVVGHLCEENEKLQKEIDSLYERIAQMRELNDKMYVLFAEASWRIRQYEAQENVKRFDPFKKGE